MRAREFISERSSSNNNKKSNGPNIPATYVLSNIKNNDAYEILRLGVAIAGARGGNPIAKSSDIGENVGVISYGEDAGKIIDQAMRELDKSGRVKKGGVRPEKASDIKTFLPQFRG